jgi:hypothetical protein
MMGLGEPVRSVKLQAEVEVTRHFLNWRARTTYRYVYASGKTS